MTLAIFSALLTAEGFRHGFSLRGGGVSQPPYDSLNLGRSVGDRPESVEQNHALLAEALGYPRERLYEVTQVHGARVIYAEPELAAHDVRALEADALVSDRADCPVAIRVADCVPVLLADVRTGAVAAVHAGWRGLVAGVLSEAVRCLGERTGSRADTLVAAIFPAIGVAAFEVGEEVAEAIGSAVDASCILRAGFTRPHVDLTLAARTLLERSGLAPARVEVVPGCTFAEPSRFFSHRRDRGATGRHLAVIVPRC